MSDYSGRTFFFCFSIAGFERAAVRRVIRRSRTPTETGERSFRRRSVHERISADRESCLSAVVFNEGGPPEPRRNITVKSGVSSLQSIQ